MTGEGELGWGVIQTEYLVSALSPEILVQCLVPCQFPDWRVCSFLASDPIGLWVLYAWQLPSTSLSVSSILFPGVTSFSQPLVSFMFWKKIIICSLSFLLSMYSIIENSQNFINSQIFWKVMAKLGRLGSCGVKQWWACLSALLQNFLLLSLATGSWRLVH